MSGIMPRTIKKEKMNIPKSITEAILTLEEMIIEEDKKFILNSEEKKVLGSYHHGIGMWMRNNWGFWKDEETPLKTEFKNMGITHPDDMSGIIITSFYRHLHGQPLYLEKQAQHYIDYWKENEI